MWLKLFLRRWLARRPLTTQTRKRNCARNWVKPRLEPLEDRVVPTVYLSDDGTTLTLTPDSTSAADLTVSSGGTALSPVLTITCSNDTMTFSCTPFGSLNSSNTTLTASQFLFTDLTINGTDTADTVNLDSLSLPPGATLTVSAGTIAIGPGDTVDVSNASLTSVNSLKFASTGVPDLGSLTVNAAPPANQPFAGDPYITGPDWGSYDYAPNDTINILNAGSLSSGNPSYTIAAIIGDNMYLDPNPQITTYLGSNLTANLTDATVQASGFTPQLQATSVILNVTGVGSTISGAIGQNPSSSDKFVVLAAQTTGGNITLEDLPPSNTNLFLGALNAGTGTIQLAVNGSVFSGAALNLLAGNNQYSQYANTVSLTADAVNLVTTGTTSFIGGMARGSLFPITTQSGDPGQPLQLTAATNDGLIDVQDNSTAGLKINSVAANQDGQAPTVNDGQVVYNSTPNDTTPTYTAGSDGVTITSTGPIVLNSVSATGNVDITGEYILEGNEQSPTIIAPSVDLVATGTADYQGQVTFGDSASGDTLSLPTGDTWSQFGFASLAAGDPIIVSGALASADNGSFIVASVSTSTITLKESYALTPETQSGVTVGDGMIGEASDAIALSEVPLFAATTIDGYIYLDAGSSVNSTARNVSAGELNGVANGVSVTSDANLLNVENITASGEAAVTMNSGALLEYNGGLITGQIVSLTSPNNFGTVLSPIETDASSGLTVDATATSPSSAAIYIDNINTSPLTAIGVSTYDGSVTILSSPGIGLSFDNSDSALSETGTALVNFANTDDNDGSDGNVVVNGTVYVSGITAGISADGTAGAGQILTNPKSSGTINGNGGTVTLSAGSGIGISGTPLNITNVATLDATTNTGDLDVTSGNSPGNTLTLSASTSTGNIDVTGNGNIDLSSEMSSSAGVVVPSISAPGTVTLNAGGNGSIADQFDSTVSADTLNLMAGAIGTASNPLEASSPGTLTLTVIGGNGGLYLDSSTAIALGSAQTGVQSGGNISISAAGNLTLLNRVESKGNITLTAMDGAITTGNTTTSAAAITTTGQQTVTPTIMESYITVGAELLIDAGQADQETVTITAVTSTTFTATFANTHAANFAISTATQSSSVSADQAGMITAKSLTITADQVGSPSDFVQTQALAINATANYGGICLSNNAGSTLALTAAAVGTSSGPTANNIEIYNAGSITLQQQSTALTQLATSVPVAVFCPGGALTLLAGETITADGLRVSGNSSGKVTSATPLALATSTLNASGGVATVSVTPGSAGSGYKTAPTVTFTGGGGGSGATATATINANGQVTGITITDPGSGYRSAPTVSISPPAGDDIYTGSYDLDGTTAVTSSSPTFLQSLVIVSGTAEVTPPRQGGSSAIPALITLADLTALALATNGNGTVPVANGTETVATTNGTTTVTITAAAITIDDLGQSGSAGTAVIPDGWSLVLDATDGSVVFLDLGDTIATTGTGTITVEAGPINTQTGMPVGPSTDVAALGNLTTGGGNITVLAGGNIAVGALTAGKTAGALGAVSVTSADGAILFNSASTSTTPNVTAISTTLTEAAQPTYSTANAALAELNATEVIAAADAASAQAVAAADAAGAQAAAELTLVNSLQAALTSIQASVATDNQTYQMYQEQENAENTTVNNDIDQVNALTLDVTIADGVAGVSALLAGVQGEAAAIVGLAVSPTEDVPFLGIGVDISVAAANLVTASFGLVAAISAEAAFGYQVELNNALAALTNDAGTLASDQANEQGALAQLQADMDTETALAAAYDVANQAYTYSEQAYANDQTISAQVQAQGDAAQANAIAGVVFASPSQPLMATAAGSGSVSERALSPLDVSANETAAGPINLTAQPEGVVSEPGDDLNVNSGVTVQSTSSSVTLVAGDILYVQSGSTIEASQPIAITANGNDDPNGATVMVAGTLIAPSASIGVDANATGNETFDITPSATTPISLDGGSDSGGVNTLNFNAEGLPVTTSGDTITAGNLAPVTFSNIQVVNITNEAGGSLTFEGTSGVANTVSLVGTGQEAGTATFNDVAFSFSGVTSFNYEGVGAGDTIAVTPYANPNLPWNLGVVVSGGTGTPAHLTYNAADPNTSVTATATDAGSVVEPGVETLLFSNVNQVTVTYQGVPNVEMLPKLTVSDAGGVYNGKAFSATAQVNGAASLDGITPTLTYYSGNLVSPQHQLTGAPSSAGTYTVDADFAGNANYISASASTTFTIAQGTPQVSVNPVKLTYGTALANSQLTGTATFIVNGTKVSVPGTYSYTSAAGTVLAASASAYTEQVTFTPTDTTDYAAQTNLSVAVTVGKATPNVTVNTVNLTPGTALANSQISGTATFIVNGTKVSVPGTYSYTSKAGTVLAASAAAYTEQVTFTPTDTTDYATLTNLSVTVNVGKARPNVTVNTVNLTYGTALANSQLSGTATYMVNGTEVSLPGTYSYTSKAGTVLATSATAYTEQVTFKPTDTTDYATLTNLSVTVNVGKATPNVTVKTVNLTFGTALANSQLSGTATYVVNGTKVTVPGTYRYTSMAGTVLAASTSAYTEQVTFTPTNTTDYATLTNLSVAVTVGKATPNVTVNTVNLTSGTALANSQLSGTATIMVNGTKVSVPGTFTYTSKAGTVLAASATAYTEQVTFTPTDTTDYVTLTNLSVKVNVKA